MTVQEAMQGIESLRLSALANLASDFGTFLTILADQPEVQALSTGMASESVREEVFRRLMGLTEAPVEDGYEHPSDTAMAAYLWLLSRVNREFTDGAVNKIAQCKECWWSRKMVDHIRKASPFRSGVEQVDVGSLVTRPRGEK